MSFATFKAKPVSSKVVLIEFGASTGHDFFLNEEPGIWRFRWRVEEDVSYGFEVGAFCYGAFEQGGSGIIGNGNAVINIISLTVDGTSYTSVSSLAGLRAQNESFWWDGEILHAHFDGFAPPWVFGVIKVGIAINEATKAGVYNSLPFGARLVSVSPLSIEADPLFFGVLGYGGITAELANADGALDALGPLDLFGQVCNIRYGEEGTDYADFKLFYSGLIRDFYLDALALHLSVSDRRWWFTRSIPPAVFDITTYPDIRYSHLGKPIPLIWGACDNVPAVCTNEEAAAPASWSFKLADCTHHPLKAIDAVRVNGAAATPASTNLAAGTFTLNLADYESGATVTADVRGYESGGTLIDNALDIITDLLEDFGGLAYTADTYDTTEWAAAKASAPAIHLFVGSSEPIESAIERVCVSLNGIMFPHGDGRMTFRYLHAAKSIAETITREQMFEEPSMRYASDNYLSSVRLGYDQDHEEGTYRRYVDDSQEADFLALYGMAYRYESETLLDSSAQAQALADNLLATYARVPLWAQVVTSIEHVELEPMGDVTVDLDRAAKARYGDVDMRVYGVRRDVMAGAVELTLRGID